MKITKLVHSCLLVEKEGVKILVDPGTYSWQDDAVRNLDFSGISSVVVTHIHPDHLSLDFAQKVVEQSPEAIWYGTHEVQSVLEDSKISCLVESDTIDIQFIHSDHADLSPWFAEQPEHTSFLLFGELLIGGDCHTLSSAHGARMFAGAINGGPWGAVVGFSKMIESMIDKPEIVLPLHDWHWNEEARQAIYSRLPDVMSNLGVKFIPLATCETQDL